MYIVSIVSVVNLLGLESLCVGGRGWDMPTLLTVLFLFGDTCVSYLQERGRPPQSSAQATIDSIRKNTQERESN